MVSGHALILAASEGIEIFAIQGADCVGNVGTVVIDSTYDFVRRLDGCDLQLGGRDDKPLVYKDVGTSRMIHRHQRQVIVIVRFPELSCNPQIVVAVACNKLVAANFVPFLSGFDSGRPNGINTKSYG